MATEVFANNPSAVVSSGGTGAPSAGTVETNWVLTGSTLPACSSGSSPPTLFHVADPAAPSEIILVTVSAGGATPTLTVTRGTEGTTPVTHGAGFTVFQVVTAGWLASLATLASPALTGTPTAPTATALTSTTQIATTAYADSAVGVETSRATTAEALKAPLASPALTGTPTAPTKTALTNSTALATTAYADAAVGVETTRATTAEALALPLAGGAMTGAITTAAGTTGTAPLVFASGTNLTTAAAGAAEYDGRAFYLTPVASTRSAVPAEQFICQSATYTLTSQTALQAIFNATTNGAVTVQSSTAYFFETEFDVTSLSATSGSFGFGILGTATFTSLKWMSMASKAATLATPNNTDTVVASVATSVNIYGSNTNTTASALVKGVLRVNAGGTVIPAVSLTQAAAGVVGVSSWFRIWAAGSSSVTNVGNWS